MSNPVKLRKGDVVQNKITGTKHTVITANTLTHTVLLDNKDRCWDTHDIINHEEIYLSKDNAYKLIESAPQRPKATTINPILLTDLDKEI